MRQKLIILISGTILIGLILYSKTPDQKTESETTPNNKEVVIQKENLGGPATSDHHPLSIELLRQGDYPGSEINIEQTLSPGSNYERYIASYRSQGLKIYGLLTIPDGPVPRSPEGEVGWPAIVFNHGYIQPDQYRTAERYTAYTDAFSRNGYVLFMPDYRGHGNSEGEARGGYGSNDYTIDVLNALSSVQKLNDVNPTKIGMWGHSMGGHITLESMVVNNDIKAGVIWAGVVGSYEDLLINWRPWWLRQGRPRPTLDPDNPRRSWRDSLQEEYGNPEENPEFWNSISATSYLKDISGPIQLHHSPADTHVPFELSEKLEQKLNEEGKVVELYSYPGDDHNLSSNLSTALSRSVEFFDRYLK